MINHFKYKIKCPAKLAWNYKTHAILKNDILSDPEIFLVKYGTMEFLSKTTKSELVEATLKAHSEKYPSWKSVMIDLHESINSKESTIEILSNNLEKITYIRMMI